MQIYVGGSTATLYASKLLFEEPAIDFVMNGEGEFTALEVCDLLRSDKSLKDCRGITYRYGNTIITNQPRPLIKNLDELPFPAIDTLMKKSEKKDYIMAGLSTSRGCYGKCAFYVANRFYNQEEVGAWRGRSPQNIVDEIIYIENAFAGKKIFYTIVDSSIEDPYPDTKERLWEFVRLMEKNNLKIAFNCLTCAESWTEKDTELINRLKGIGLFIYRTS